MSCSQCFRSGRCVAEGIWALVTVVLRIYLVPSFEWLDALYEC